MRKNGKVVCIQSYYNSERQCVIENKYYTIEGTVSVYNESYYIINKLSFLYKYEKNVVKDRLYDKKFSDYFMTITEYRKLKIKKLNEINLQRI